MIRWATTLSAYTYGLIYIQGRANNADGLSKLPLPECPTDLPFPQDVFNFFFRTGCSARTAALIAEETKSDIVLQKGLNLTILGWPERICDGNLKTFLHRKHKLRVDNECWFWGTKVVIPASLQYNVINLLHEEHIIGIVEKSVKQEGMCGGLELIQS